ncbi:aminopeptidase N isoform X2 [Lepeophtheirus salmonis]|uniref:aminopeptidase N isoform X2 n=1 Tax=Lepeophtheirus salmonis TaxID=72036 RepID=UPI001AE63CEF|nr:aminopeptidase N-like isoform X2 [Lepeophtheirus salmonis]
MNSWAILFCLFARLTFILANNETGFRLPINVIPVNYFLNLSTQHTQNYAVDGFVKIEVKCIKATHNITLHSSNLEIQNVSVLNGTSSTNHTSIISFGDETNDFLIIALTEKLVINRTYYIEINYRMKEWPMEFGFFKTEYNNNKGEEKEMYATQFQAIHARSAFPCFDEPELKATFDITLGHYSNLTTVSNMPNISITTSRSTAGYAYDKFNTTPIMSTYLIAFAMVSDHSHIDVNASDVQLQLWAPKDSISQLNTSLDCSPNLYNFFYDYYNYSQPLSIEKMLPVPNYPGGMENWGLFIFEKLLFLDDGGMDLESLKNLNDLYLLIAHEFNHLWLGNLVTVKWWTEVWLNEGLTSYMSYLAVHKTYANISSMDEQIFVVLTDVMDSDSSSLSPPIKEKIVNSNAKILDCQFSYNTYEKGAFLTKMMSDFIGEETLKIALRTYVAKFAYKSVDEDDFLHVVLETAPNSNIKDIVKSWTRQGGFPMVNVSIDYDSGKITVTQERFLFDSHTNVTKIQKWWIPLRYKAIAESETEVKTVWMDNTERSKVFEIEEIKNTSTTPILLNWNFTGIYKVNYDSESWKRIINQLIKNNSVITMYSRAQLIKDVFTLAKAGKQNYTLPLELIRYIPYENESLPRVIFYEEMEKIMTSLFSVELDWKFRNYMRKIFDKKQIGINPPTERNYYKKYNWALDLGFSCQFDIKKCTQKFVNKFKKWMRVKNIQKIGVDSDTLEIMVCTAIRNGTQREWRFLLYQLLKTTYSAKEKQQFLSGLTCSTNVTTLYKLLLLSGIVHWFQERRRKNKKKLKK